MMLSDIQLSDLFFNYDHPGWENECAELDGDPEGAIRKDAEDFARNYPEFGKNAEWYVQDFLRRV